MAHKRSNKCKRWGGSVAQPWWYPHVKRQRRRRDIAFESRRRNRGINRGKRKAS